jgi:hypothetical protein
MCLTDLNHSHRYVINKDTYYLYYQNDSVHYANGTGPEVRNTFGTRLFGKINGGIWCFALPPVVAFLGRITAKSSPTTPTVVP